MNESLLEELTLNGALALLPSISTWVAPPADVPSNVRSWLTGSDEPSVTFVPTANTLPSKVIVSAAPELRTQNRRAPVVPAPVPVSVKALTRNVAGTKRSSRLRSHSRVRGAVLRVVRVRGDAARARNVRNMESLRIARGARVIANQ